MKRWLLSTVACAAVVAFSMPAQAQSVINFDDLTFADYDEIGDHATNYGDRLAGTPNVVADFRTLGHPTIPDDISLWNTSYGDLSKVGFAVANGYTGEVALTPDAGYVVILNSFDLAGWPHTDYVSDIIQVLDGNDNVLLDWSGSTVLGAGPSHSSYVVGLSSSNGLKIRWGNNWDIGIDNIDFNQRFVGGPRHDVPEPGTMALLIGASVVGLNLRKRTRR